MGTVRTYRAYLGTALSQALIFRMPKPSRKICVGKSSGAAFSGMARARSDAKDRMREVGDGYRTYGTKVQCVVRHTGCAGRPQWLLGEGVVGGGGQGQRASVGRYARADSRFRAVFF